MKSKNPEKTYRGLVTAAWSAFILSVHAFLFVNPEEGSLFMESLLSLSGLFVLILCLHILPISLSNRIIIPFGMMLSLASLFFLPYPFTRTGIIFLAPLGLLLVKAKSDPFLPGITLGLTGSMISFLLPEFQMITLSILIGCHVFWIFFTYPSLKAIPENISVISAEHGFLSMSLNLGKFILMVIGILLILTLPFYGSVFHYAGYVTGIILLFFISPVLIDIFQKKSLAWLLLFLFITSLVNIIILGFYSRTFTWSAFVCAALQILIPGIILLGSQVVQKIYGEQNELGLANKKFTVLILSGLIGFLILQIPAGMYWLDRLEEVEMPEKLHTMALGQYVIKNLTLLASMCTLIFGYLYLRRRGIQ